MKMRLCSTQRVQLRTVRCSGDGTGYLLALRVLPLSESIQKQSLSGLTPSCALETCQCLVFSLVFSLVLGILAMARAVT